MEVHSTTTVFPPGERIKQIQTLPLVPDDGVENHVVNLYPQATDQRFEGFGGAFTDAAGSVFALMGRDDQDRFLESYFDEDQMNYCLGRLPLDSCDFSTHQYEALSDPDDRAMATFSLAGTERHILPLLNAAQRRRGAPLEVLISPWSPPAFMKTNGRRTGGGKLRPEMRDFWAGYLCRYITELRSRGLQVRRMTLQNEPAAIQAWDSCLYTAEEERDFLKRNLFPALRRSGLEDVEVYLWDHNKERLFERACVVCGDGEASALVAGFAFHWYSGDHFEAVDLVHRQFPDKKLILSEACIEYSKFSAEKPLANAQKYAHDMIGNLNAGMTAFYDWNLILDEHGGPNYVDNFCDAPYLYDTGKHKLLRRATLDYLWHFSHFIHPGAVRIGFSKYTDQLEVTAFRNPDGRLACVLLNRTKNQLPVHLRVNGSTAALVSGPESISTLVVQD